MKTNQEDKNVSTNFKVEGTRKAVEPLIKRQRRPGYCSGFQLPNTQHRIQIWQTRATNFVVVPFQVC